MYVCVCTFVVPIKVITERVRNLLCCVQKCMYSIFYTEMRFIKCLTSCGIEGDVSALKKCNKNNYILY